MRIIEAFIAVMLIAGFMLVLYYTKVKPPNERDSVVQLERLILEKIASDDSLRQAVLNGYPNTPEGESNRTILENEINTSLPSNYDFTFRICDLNEVCGLDKNREYYTKNQIFSDEVSVSSTLFTYTGPKKLRLFIWEID